MALHLLPIFTTFRTNDLLSLSVDADAQCKWSLTCVGVISSSDIDVNDFEDGYAS